MIIRRSIFACYARAAIGVAACLLPASSNAERLTPIVREELGREDVPAPTFLPIAPAGVERGPDQRWDLPGVRAWSGGWLSHDGQTFLVFADRAPAPKTEDRFSAAGRIPPEWVLLELDLQTLSIQRETDLEVPDHEPGTAYWIEPARRLLHWRPITDPRDARPLGPHREGVPVIAAPRHGGWEFRSIPLGHSGVAAVRRVTPPDGINRGAWQRNQNPRRARQFKTSADGQQVWWLIGPHSEQEDRRLRVECWDAATLETVSATTIAWALPQAWDDRGNHPLYYLNWTLEDSARRIHLAFTDLNTDPDGRFPVRTLSFDLDTGKKVSGGSVTTLKNRGRGTRFYGDRRHLAVLAGGIGSNAYYGPLVLWDPEAGEPTAVLSNQKGWGTGFRRPAAGSPYFFHTPISTDDQGRWLIWRYDHDKARFSWPRDLHYTRGGTRHRISADGRTLVAFNRFEGRSNRLGIYRFSDQEAYDPELAARLAEQSAIPQRAHSLPPAHQRASASPNAPEIKTDREPLPAIEARVIAVAASNDGTRLATITIPADHPPSFQMGDPAVQARGRVLNTNAGKTLFTFDTPFSNDKGMLYQSQLAFAGDNDQWLVVSSFGSLNLSGQGRSAGPGLAQLQVFDTTTGNPVRTLAFDSQHSKTFVRFSVVNRFLRHHLLIRVTGPAATAFHVLNLPDLETVATLTDPHPAREGRPDAAPDDQIRDAAYDPARHEFVAVLQSRKHDYRAGRRHSQDQWIQRYDAETGRSTGRIATLDGRHHPFVNLARGPHLAVTFTPPPPDEDTPSRSVIQIYRFDTPKPILQVDTAAYLHGSFPQFVAATPWLALRPAAQQNGRPGIVLVHAERGTVLGPWPISDARSILWIDDEGRRMLVRPEPEAVPFNAQPNPQPPAVWLIRKDDD